MRRVLWIISLVTLATVIAAIVAQALTVTQAIYYTPSGQPTNPSAVTQAVTILGVAGIFSLPLAAGTFVLGIVASGLEHRSGWLVAVVVAGMLAFVGMLVMVWILLSERSPIALQTPLLVIPLVTLAYAVLPASPRSVTSVAA